MSELRQIEEIAQVKQGRYTSPNELSEIPTEYSKVPVWGANGILGYTQNATYEEAQPLVTCRGNGCGLIQWSGGRAHISNNAMAIVLPNQSQQSSKYLYYSLLNTDFTDVTTGSAQPQITMGHLNKKEIFWHSNPEERTAIAHILGTLDDKIELNRKTNETLEAMAKALFKSWFVDFDPVRAKEKGAPLDCQQKSATYFQIRWRIRNWVRFRVGGRSHRLAIT
jgi:type I restriction enzyme S subunit